MEIGLRQASGSLDAGKEGGDEDGVEGVVRQSAELCECKVER